jgi:hypothetical protein
MHVRLVIADLLDKAFEFVLIEPAMLSELSLDDNGEGRIPRQRAE